MLLSWVMADDGTSQGTQMYCGAGQPVFWDCGNDGALEIVCKDKNGTVTETYTCF